MDFSQRKRDPPSSVRRPEKKRGGEAAADARDRQRQGLAPITAVSMELVKTGALRSLLTLATNENTRGGTDTRFAPTFDGDVERWADWHFAFTAYAHSRKW